MLDGLIDKRAPPLNWEHDYEGGKEHHLTEGAVMVAFAMNLLRTIPVLGHVAIHPDGPAREAIPIFRMAHGEWLQAHKGARKDKLRRPVFIADLRPINLGQPREPGSVRCYCRHSGD